MYIMVLVYPSNKSGLDNEIGKREREIRTGLKLYMSY